MDGGGVHPAGEHEIAGPQRRRHAAAAKHQWPRPRDGQAEGEEERADGQSDAGDDTSPEPTAQPRSPVTTLPPSAHYVFLASQVNAVVAFFPWALLSSATVTTKR